DRAAVVETASGLRIRGQLTDPAASPDAGTAVTLAVRPERLHVEAAPDGGDPAPRPRWSTVPRPPSPGTHLGASTEYRIGTDAAGEVVVRLQNRAGEQHAEGFGPGQPVLIRWPDEATLVLAS